MRFQKRIKLLPGIKINLSRRGMSLSIGKPGATLNLGIRGAKITAGIPGTGISHTESLNRREPQRFTSDVEPSGSDDPFEIAIGVAIFVVVIGLMIWMFG